MKILAIECSAAPVSCALVDGGRLVGEYYLNRNMTHSQTLMPMIDSLVKMTDCKLSDIDIFAVSAGPGSFTGVRIGISAVKGMAFTRNSPCCAVSPLEAMAYNYLGSEAVVVGCMDARCNQVYNAVFKVCGQRVERLCEDRAISVEQLVGELCGKTAVLVGDGAHIVYKACQEAGLQGITLSPENLRFQRASGVAFAGEKMYNEEKWVTADKLLPIYLRLPQAERELKAKEGKI